MRRPLRPGRLLLRAGADLGEAVESPHLRARGLVRRHPRSSIYEAAYPVLVDGLTSFLAEPLRDDAEGADTPGG